MSSLLAAGANFNNRSDKGMSPLHIAARDGLENSVRLLLGAAPRSTINAVTRDRNHWTALHWAAYRNHAACVLLLVSSGASIYRKDNFNCTPIDVATKDCRDILVAFDAHLKTKWRNVTRVIQRHLIGAYYRPPLEGQAGGGGYERAREHFYELRGKLTE